MADAQETTADIIAEKRRRADELEASSYRPHQFLRERIAELRQEADRLEAARKRDTKELRVEIERLKEERNYSGVRERERLRAKGFAIVPKEQLERGDAAKLREAVESIASNLEHRLFARYPSSASDEWMYQKAKAALSAPPRNCDLALDWMRDLYAHFQPPASVKREMPPEWVDAVMAFCRWLVAPATEQEGGTK